MLRKLLFTLGLILTSSVLIFAQSGALKGKVQDSKTGEALPFANVVIKQGGTMINGASTDFDGNYTIKPLDPGTYVLEVTVMGYSNQRINKVLINADKTRFLNVKMESSDIQLETFVVKDFKVPLIDKDNTVSGETKTAEDIKNMANRSVTGIVANTGGVVSEDGEIGSIRGSRSDATVTYIDGIRVLGSSSLPQSAIDQVSIILGGTPAQYGDARGGIINVTTKGASRNFGGGLEIESSELTDPYGNNRLGFSAMGPLIKGKEKDVALFGYFIAGDFYYRKDGRPSATTTWIANDDVLEDIQNQPLRPTGLETGGTYKKGEFVHKEDLHEVKTTPNTAQYGANVSAKLDVKTSKNTNLTFGGQYNYSAGNSYSFTNAMYNSAKNTYRESATWRVFGRFTQRFPTNSDKSSLIKNVYYTIQADYTQITASSMDPDFKDDLFKYGYLGSYETAKTPTFLRNEETTLLELNSWDFDTTYLLNPASVSGNEYMANYTNQIYDLYPNKWGDFPFGSGNWLNEDNLSANGGLLNGDNGAGVLAGNMYYGMWNAPGSIQTGYSFRDDSQVSANLAAAMDVGNHELKFGFQFEQRKSSGYSYGPLGLWGLMRREVNSHIKELNLNSPYYSAYGDTVFYPRLYDANAQFTFDKNLREALDLKVDGLDFILTDSYNFVDKTIQYYDKDGVLHTTGFEGFSIDMFSADELLNNGSAYASYYGYDYKGDKLDTRPTFDDFFNEKGEDGNYTRNIPAFEPIYMAGYIQDKFAFEDLVFNIGLRLDRFDANQPVLKDPFLIIPAKTVSEVDQIDGAPINHPENMGSDYVVYVDNAKNPASITGYRKDFTWYDKLGNEIANPDLLDQGSGINPYLSDTSISAKVFKDYVPQVNFMPRISFSFPISEEALFFAHYDVLTQRPTLALYSDPSIYKYFNVTTQGSRAISNPSLKPATTVEYEIGFQQKLTESSSLKINTFYREMKDDIQIRRFYGAYPRSYTSYSNYDFGTVKGVTITYDLRRTNNVRVNAGYTLQFAAGTGSNANTAAALINAGLPNLRVLNPFDFDRRHNINLMLDYRFGYGKTYNGPKGIAQKILQQMGANFTVTGGSGTPYTARKNIRSVLNSGTNELKGTINGSRLPWQFRVDMKIDKDLVIQLGKKDEDGNRSGKEFSVNVYALVLNLFNNKNIMNVYPATGSPTDDGYLASPEWQNEINSKIDPSAYRDLYSIYITQPGNFSMPRQIRVGLSINF